MDVNGLSTLIQDRYRMELAGFREQLLGPEEILLVRGESVPEQRFAGMGPVASLDNPRISITLAGEVADLGWTEEDPTADGVCLTVSVAGRDRVTGERVALSTGETDAWLQAFLGTERVGHAYRAGALRGGSGSLTTVYYRLFLDTEGNPIPKPEDYDDADLRRMGEL